MANEVKFIEITKTKFNQIATKDEGALYIVKDGTKRELWKGSSFIAGSDEGGAESNYNEVEITTLSSGETIYLSQLASYKKIKIELYAESIVGGSGNLELSSYEFDPTFFTRKSVTITSKSWQQTFSPPSMSFVIELEDSSLKTGAQLATYLNNSALYKASYFEVGDLAKNTNGAMMSYAVVVSNNSTIYRNTAFKLNDDCSFSTNSSTTAIFTNNNSDVVYKLKVIGVNY